jgi:hypothetical protein
MMSSRRKTFVELIEGSAPVDSCQWKGCTVPPTYRVGQYDPKTADEDEASIRYMCSDHAFRVQQMVDEVEQG